MNKQSFFKHLSIAIGLLVAAAFIAPPPSRGQDADQVVILLNARNPTASLTKAQMRNMFLGKTAFWHGVVPVKVFVRPPANAASKAFFEPVVGMTPQAYTKHWDKLQLSGRGVAPKALGTAKEMAEWIAKTPGGIGYALASEAWQINGVKIVPVK